MMDRAEPNMAPSFILTLDSGFLSKFYILTKFPFVCLKFDWFSVRTKGSVSMSHKSSILAAMVAVGGRR